MWSWISALYDGGLQLLLSAALVAAAATLAHRMARDRAEWWEGILVLVGVFVLFAGYQTWDLPSASTQWHAFPPTEAQSTLTYGKQVWLDLWGVLAGRAAYSFLGHWFLNS